MGELSARVSAMTEGVRPAEDSGNTSGGFSFTLGAPAPSVRFADSSPIEGERVGGVLRLKARSGRRGG